jgi:hypothetical protein
MLRFLDAIYGQIVVVTSGTIVNSDARGDSISQKEKLEVMSDRSTDAPLMWTYCCEDHQPIVQTKRLHHPDANITSQNARKQRRNNECNVDCKQLRSSIWDGHGEFGGGIDACAGRVKGAQNQHKQTVWGMNILYVSRLPYGSGAIQRDA